METQLKNTVLVVFGKDFPVGRILEEKFDTIVADKMFQDNIKALGSHFIELETLIDSGSVREASVFLEGLSRLDLPNGSRPSKSFLYKGYELWWIHYTDFFNYFCLPYTQYKKLLKYLMSFSIVHLYQPPYKDLFSYYLQAYECEYNIIQKRSIKSLSFIPSGIFLQIIITLISLPFLIIKKSRLMVFIGDKFDKSQDYDFRMKFIYQELRGRNIPFVEFIRSLESWKTVIGHAIRRKRPVIYSEGVTFIGRFMSIISGGRRRAKEQFGSHNFDLEANPEIRFKLLIAMRYLHGVYDSVWAIRIMKLILRIIGVKVAMIPAATDRNFHAVLGCKLRGIPTVGILHGVAFRHSIPCEFMSGFNGEKMLSVDFYGVWSEWWKKYYIKESDAYKPEQLYVSGPIRPLEVLKESNSITESQSGLPRVLFISEQIAVPSELMPYLYKLLKQSDIKLTIKFRPFRDGFENWLLENEPEILKLENIGIVRGGMQEAIQNTDVVVGCKSTAVLESLLQLKVPIFFRTAKWGDYFNMTESSERRHFFAENPEELIERIKDARNLPRKSIARLCEQYFGDPYKNGSKWVVDKIEQILDTEK